MIHFLVHASQIKNEIVKIISNTVSLIYEVIPYQSYQMDGAVVPSIPGGLKPNDEAKSEPLMLGIEMSTTNIDENKTVIYKQNLNNINQESLANIASLFRISRNHQWADTVWSMSNVNVTNKSGQSQTLPLKDLIKQGNYDIYSGVELKLPSLKVIFTDGYRQYTVICSVSAKLGLIDQWMKQSEESIWFRKSLMSNNIVYYEVPTTFVQTMRQLSMSQHLYDLYGPNLVYIYVKSREQKTWYPSIRQQFEIREQALLDTINQSSMKKDNISFATWLAKELRSSLPKYLEVNEHRDPIISHTHNGFINQWDIMISDNLRSFKFGGDFLPNATVATIDCQQEITIQKLMDIEKQFAKSTGKPSNVIQCLVSYQQTIDEKSLIFERIMAMQDSPGLDLILILGIGAFVRLRTGTNSRYIYLKDPGVCLQSLYMLIGQHIIQNNPSDLSEYIGLVQ